MSLLTLDSMRMEAGRADCFPWQELTVPDASPAPLTFELEAPPADSNLHGYHHRAHPRSVIGAKATIMQRAMQRLHGKLAVPAVKLAVLLAVVVGCMSSLSALQRIEIGLDQRVALPRDSYLQTYYRYALLLWTTLALH